MKEKIELTVEFKQDHTDIVVLTNSNGDTYTSKSEEIIDFLHNEKSLSSPSEEEEVKPICPKCKSGFYSIKRINNFSLLCKCGDCENEWFIVEPKTEKSITKGEDPEEILKEIEKLNVFKKVENHWEGIKLAPITTEYVRLDEVKNLVSKYSFSSAVEQEAVKSKKDLHEMIVWALKNKFTMTLTGFWQNQVEHGDKIFDTDELYDIFKQSNPI